MKRGIALVAAALSLLASCATQLSLSFEEGESLLADGPVLKDVWDANAAAADVEAGVQWNGRTALEISQPYGNSFMVWHFTGFSPEEAVQVSIDLWIDAVANDSWVELHWAPGLIPATTEGLEAIRTNAEKEGGFYFKWDSGGVDMGATTDGWMTVVDDSQIADSQGNFTVGIWMGHWSNNPSVVPVYVDNLTVATAQ